MIPSPQAQNTEETQIVNSPVPQFSATDFLSQMPQLQLSEAKTKDLEKRRSPRNTHGKTKRGDDSGDDDTVSCECGYNDEEDDMVSQSVK
jgi:meiosis-specific protein HOP1